jgi:ADP-heptose:LPS heptosyltransferase
MIIIAPYAQKLRNGNNNPKNYPWWPELISLINEPIVQVGVQGETQLVDDFRQNLSLNELKDLVLQCRMWISVDSFFQHFCWDINKYGIVLWGQSDPNIFGHPENINLLKDRKYLREKQFWWWEQCEYNAEAFVKPEEVLKYL